MWKCDVDASCKELMLYGRWNQAVCPGAAKAWKGTRGLYHWHFRDWAAPILHVSTLTGGKCSLLGS